MGERGHAQELGDPAWGRPQQLPLVAGLDREGAPQPGPPRVLAEPRAPQLLGHRRLDRFGVRHPLRRCVRVPQPATARTLRRTARLVDRPAAPIAALVATGTTAAVLLRGSTGSLGPNLLLLTVAYAALAVV